MATPLQQFIKIKQDRDAALAVLAEIEDPALREFNRLTNKASGGQTLSATEQAALEEADAALGRVHHGMWLIGQVSLQAMNDSALLRDIKNSLKGISKDLDKTKAKLDKIVKIAGITARAVAALVKLAEKVGAAAI